MARRVTAPKEEAPDEIQSLKYEVAAALKRIEALEANRPGRKAKPLVAVRQDGVCAVSPDIDSATCENSSIFRYQQGCWGTACKAKQHNAYERRKEAKAAAETPVTVKPKRASKTPAPTKPKATKTTTKKAPARSLAAVG